MAKYKFEIYKVQSIIINLESYKIVHKNNSLLAKFNDSSQLKKNDVIWSEGDIYKNDSSQMLIVKAVLPNGIVRLKRIAGYESLEDLRNFEHGEVFKVIASFIKIEDGSTVIGKIKSE